MPRTDTVARTIAATPDAIYQALMDPEMLVKWLPPAGMSGRIDIFEPHVGGRYRIVLTHNDPAIAGRSGGNMDVIEGHFTELVPGQRIVEQLGFAVDDAALAGTMTMAWILASTSGGTDVTLRCEGVPDGIGVEDNDISLRSMLANLAAFMQ